ncbi:MAG: hypothetical protein V4695_00460 [Pseudomonadota bacterium]
MASTKTPLPKSAPTAERIKTEADARSILHRADKSAHSSQDAKSHDKAGSTKGAGGGKKQERKH